jgi:hypothetical protein
MALRMAAHRPRLPVGVAAKANAGLFNSCLVHMRGYARMARAMGTAADHGRCMQTDVSSWYRCRLMSARRAGQGMVCAGLALLIATSACSVIVDPDAAKLGGLPVPCETGRTVICPCPDGTTSTQTCNTLARYDVCVCKGQAGRAGEVGMSTAGRGTAGRSAAGAAGH